MVIPVGDGFGRIAPEVSCMEGLAGGWLLEFNSWFWFGGDAIPVCKMVNVSYVSAVYIVTL